MLPLAPFCVAVLLAPQGPGAESRPDLLRSASLAQVRAAVASVSAAAAAAPAVDHGFSTVYRGSVLIEGHDRTPGLRRRVPVEIAIDCGGSGQLAVRETTGEGARASMETTLVAAGRVVRQGSAREPFKEIAGTAAGEAAASAMRWLPATALHACLAARASCRASAPVELDGVTLSPITFTDASAGACSLLLDGEGRVARIESLAADPRLGDICEWTRFDGYERSGKVVVPARISRFVAPSSVTLEYDLQLAELQDAPPPPASFEIPEARRADVPGFGRASPASGFEFVEVAPRLWSVEIAAADTRAFVIERESDLVLIDAPDGDDVSVSLLGALAAKFPAKRVSLATLGHHHPSPSGGLRAIAASGATILAPRGLEPHVRWLLARPVTLGGAAVAGPKEPALEWFEGRTRIEAGPNSVTLLDIADRSAHAFHYVVFYFPESGLLFEDDLGWFPEKGAPRWSPRLAGLGQALAEAGIVPKRLVQAWPVKGARREVPWSEVQAAIDAPPSRPTSR